MISRLLRVLFFVMVVAAGQPTTTTLEAAAKPTPSTIVDILSSQAQYSYFLRHLQLQGMIPLINSLENVTLLAPINSAFTDGNLDTSGNVLLRYIINQKVRIGWLGKDEVVYSTLYPLNSDSNYSVSVKPDLNAKEYVVDGVSAIVEPDIYAKHQHSFIQGIEKLLPLKPTLCEVLMNPETTIIGGKDIRFMKTMFQLVFTLKTCEEYLANAKTMLIPSDDLLMKSLTSLQLQYYLSLFESITSSRFVTTKEATKEMTHDILSLLAYLKLPQLIAGVNGTNLTYSGNKGTEFQIYLHDHVFVVNNIRSNGNVVMSNGVIHVFDTSSNKDLKKTFFKALKIPVVLLTPRKTLYALHFSRFAKELSFRNLDYLIDGSSHDQSLFLDLNDRDDVPDDEANSSKKKVSENEVSANEITTNSFSMKQSLLYQFSDAVNITKELAHKDELYSLVPSKLCSKKKIGGCFNLKVASTKTRGNTVSTLNDNLEIIEGPIDMGSNSFLYLVNGDIESPSSFKHALGEIMSSGSIPRHTEHFAVNKQSCLTSLEILNDFKLFNLEDNSNGYSVFLPCGMGTLHRDQSNWQDLGLILTYLQSKPELFKLIVKGMFIEDIVYTDKEKSRISTNLNGNEVRIKSIPAKENHIIRLNNTEISVPVNSDIIFNQGVIHLINKVLLPDDFQVPFVDLLQTTIDDKYPNHSIMDLLDLFPKIKLALGLAEETVKAPFSLLVPSPSSLSNFNITTDFTKLLEFIEFHLVPQDQVGKILTCIGIDDYEKNITNIKTNLTSASLTCYQSKSGNRYLQLVDPVPAKAKSSQFNILSYNKDREVKIVNHGCTHGHEGKHSKENLQCVFLIEKPLNLQWLTPNNDSRLHVHLGFISLGIGIILGLLIFASILFSIILCLGKGNNKKSPKLPHQEEFLPRNENHFMRVRINNDDLPAHDRGYETDIDILRDNDEFLPLYGTKKLYKKRDYGSIKNSTPIVVPTAPAVSAPRDIKNVANILSRNRNLPDA